MTSLGVMDESDSIFYEFLHAEVYGLASAMGARPCFAAAQRRVRNGEIPAPPVAERATVAPNPSGRLARGVGDALIISKVKYNIKITFGNTYSRRKTLLQFVEKDRNRLLIHVMHPVMSGNS